MANEGYAKAFVTAILSVIPQLGGTSPRDRRIIEAVIKKLADYQTVHATSTGASHSAVVTNSAHVAGDGSDHADVATNTGHITSSGAGHTYIDQNVTTSGTPSFSTLTGSGGRIKNETVIATTAAAYTVLSTDHIIAIDPTSAGGNVTATLPVGVAGTEYEIYCLSTSANDVVITPNVADAIGYLTAGASVTITSGADVRYNFVTGEGWR